MQSNVNDAKYQEYEEIEERLGIMTEPRLDGSLSSVDFKIIKRLEERSAYLRRVLVSRGVHLPYAAQRANS